MTKSIDLDNDRVNIKLDVPKSKYEVNTSENFKTLKELSKQNISPIENKTNQILLNKTEQAMKESEKTSTNISESIKNKTEQQINDNSNIKSTRSIKPNSITSEIEVKKK